MTEKTEKGESTGTASPPAVDVQALQNQVSDYRALAGILLGREIKPDETPGAIAAQVAQQRDAAARASLEKRAALSEGILQAGYQVPTGLDYALFSLDRNPDAAPLFEKKDWGGVLSLAEKAGLLTKPQAQAQAAPPAPPPIRPPTAQPDARAEQFPNVKTKEDLKRLGPVELAILQKTDPKKFAALIQ